MREPQPTRADRIGDHANLRISRRARWGLGTVAKGANRLEEDFGSSGQERFVVIANLLASRLWIADVVVASNRKLVIRNVVCRQPPPDLAFAEVASLHSVSQVAN